jgi:lipopolysaccharide transport system ATP-binding protein
MSETLIKVEKLSKKYVIRHQGAAEGLRHALQEVAKTPFRWFKQSLGAGSVNGHDHRLNGGQAAKLNPQKSSEDFWALKEVSFEVKQGEVVGIIGRNGAGKSTLLKILSRITEPTVGRIQITGRVASLLEVGTGFHPELTGRENIFLNGAILGMSRAEIRRKFDAIVAFAEVDRFLDTPVKRYSSGMYVRLAFAVAAHLEPEILIVDEVLAVGDAEFQKKCLGKMQEVSKGGRTVLFVSHNVGAIKQLCDRCILFRSGTVQQDGPCDEVISNYLTDATLCENGVIDLRHHPARSRASKPLISEIVIRNGQDQPTAQLFPEEALLFDITIASFETIRNPRVALAIEDSHGRRLMTMASYFDQSPLPNLSGKTTIRCESSPLQLGPGRYLLSVSIGTKEHGLIDSIDGASWFEILWNNNYRNGEPYQSVYGPFLKSSKWEVVYD